MTVTTDRKVFEDLRAGQDEVPHVAGGRGWRTNLVTIPTHTSEQNAAAAMEEATQAGNREHAPAILAAILAVA